MGIPDTFLSSPAIGDIDGDGYQEIVIAGMDRRLHAWHHDGSYVNGWPIGRDRNLWRGGISSPALADIDADGVLEILVGTNDYARPACPNPYHFYALEGDGSFVPGFPIETSQNIASSPAVGDLDGDGWLDIVVGTGSFNESCGQDADGHKVYAWDRNGNPLPGWPRATAGNMETSPAIGDLDGDGESRGCHWLSRYHNIPCHYLYAWHGDGTPVTGFPILAEGRFLQRQGPILADVEGDGMVEILMASGLEVIVVEANGSINRSLTRRANFWRLGGLTVADIDGDQLLETVVLDRTNEEQAALRIWQESGSVTGQIPWPMFQRNPERTSLQPALFTINGEVRGERNAALSNISVLLKNNRTGAQRTTTTSSAGAYTFTDVEAGKYLIQPQPNDDRYAPASRLIQLPPRAGPVNFKLFIPTNWAYLPFISKN